MAADSRVDINDLLKATKIPPRAPKSCPVCHKIFSKYAGPTQQMRHIEACQRKKLLASLPRPLREKPYTMTPESTSLSCTFAPESSVIGDAADGSVNGPVPSGKAKHATLNLDLVRLAKDRAIPLECLSSGVASLGRWEEVNKYRSQILEDTRNLAARVRQLASETSPIPLEDSSWIQQFPRATILWGTEGYVTDAKVPLGRAWQQRCRQRQSDILELEADPRCVVALGMLDLSSAFAELESRFRVNPRERLNARRRLERQMKAKTKSKPEAESTIGPTSSTAEGHPNA